MKKYGRIGTLVFLVFFMVFSTSLFAATTGTLTLTGTVPPILEITVTALPAASSLDLTTNTDVAVATVTERSNKKGGYTVTVESANAQAAGSVQPFFKSSDPTNTDTLSYSITYGGSAVTFSSGSAVVTDSNFRTPGAGTSKEVRVTYTGDFLYEDTYTDTLTFTITAK